MGNVVDITPPEVTSSTEIILGQNEPYSLEKYVQAPNILSIAACHFLIRNPTTEVQPTKKIRCH